MPDLIAELGAAGVWGAPWHGQVNNGTLLLPNATTRDYMLPNPPWSGCNFALRVPGTAEITRTPEEAAGDAAAGYQWRPDVMLWFSSGLTRVHGVTPLTVGRWLYAVVPGKVYEVILDSLSFSSGSLGTLTLRRYGVLREFDTPSMWTPEEHVLTIPGAGFTSADNGWLSLASTLWDVSPAGDRAILQYVTDSGGVLTPNARNGAVLITISGNGDDTPFAVSVTPLHRGTAALDYSYTNTIGQRYRSSSWALDITTSYSPGPTARPRTETTSWNGGVRALGPEVTTDPAWPRISYYVGAYTAQADDVPVAFWLTEGGTTAITANYTYNREHTHSQAGSITASPARVQEVQIGTDGSIVSTTVTTAGSYLIEEEAEVTTLETWSVKLYAGGELLGEADFRFEHSQVWELSETRSGDDLAGTLMVPPNTISGTHKPSNKRLYNSTVWENLTTTLSTAGLPVEYGIPPTSIKPEQLAYPGNPTYLLSAELYNGANSKRLKAGSFWYSNKLACMTVAEFTLPAGVRQWTKYGYAAYPGGTYGTAYTVAGSAARYGSWNPITGQVAAGLTTPVNWV